MAYTISPFGWLVSYSTIRLVFHASFSNSLVSFLQRYQKYTTIAIIITATIDTPTQTFCGTDRDDKENDEYAILFI